MQGSSGAGKTTFLNLLSGRANVGKREGTLLYDGREWHEQLRRTIGYVEQQSTLLPQV